MKIVQTFWSLNRDLTQNNFGWQSPQHHVMEWALSCLKLREYYDDLHLYTDTNGIAILIDYQQADVSCIKFPLPPVQNIR